MDQNTAPCTVCGLLLTDIAFLPPKHQALEEDTQGQQCVFALLALILVQQGIPDPLMVVGLCVQESQKTLYQPSNTLSGALQMLAVWYHILPIKKS